MFIYIYKNKIKEGPRLIKGISHEQKWFCGKEESRKEDFNFKFYLKNKDFQI